MGLFGSVNNKLKSLVEVFVWYYFSTCLPTINLFLKVSVLFTAIWYLLYQISEILGFFYSLNCWKLLSTIIVSTSSIFFPSLLILRCGEMFKVKNCFLCQILSLSTELFITAILLFCRIASLVFFLHFLEMVYPICRTFGLSYARISPIYILCYA